MLDLPSKSDLIMIASELCHRKFVPGIDNVTAQSNLNNLLLNGDIILDSISRGQFHPLPALLFSTVKKNGDERNLCRFSALDIVIQRAMARKLSDYFMNTFSSFSYGYIPGRGVQSAVTQFLSYGNEFPYVAVIDPHDCFDSIDRDVLYRILGSVIDSELFLSLLRAYAEVPVADETGIKQRPRGILQGSPLSPVLCNLYFHSLDLILEEKEIPFCRYGDDVVVFADSYEHAVLHASFVTDYMTKNLHLSVNPEKFRIAKADNIEYLGYSFVRDNNGRLVAVEGTRRSAEYAEDWLSNRLFTDPKKINLVSDGILSRKEFSLLFETDTSKTILPAGSIDQLNVYSSVVFAPYVLKEAFHHGIRINVFDSFGELLGNFTPASNLKNITVSLNQLEIYRRKKGLRADYARDFLLSQLHNIRLNLRYQCKEYNYPKCKETLDRLKVTEKQIKSSKSTDDLLLIEARMREDYYSCFSEMIRNKDFRFTKRTRRPPKDEVNSMISFANTFLYNYFAVEINRTALDIRIAFLHSATSRAQSLNLDLADVFKPLLVDRVIFSLINRKMISTSHFAVEENGGVLLTNDGKRILLDALAEKLASKITVKNEKKSYAEIIRDEVYSLVADIKAMKKHRSFRQVR